MLQEGWNLETRFFVMIFNLLFCCLVEASGSKKRNSESSFFCILFVLFLKVSQCFECQFCKESAALLDPEPSLPSSLNPLPEGEIALGLQPSDRNSNVEMSVRSPDRSSFVFYFAQAFMFKFCFSKARPRTQKP